jgi:hypothetical protein
MEAVLLLENQIEGVDERNTCILCIDPEEKIARNNKTKKQIPKCRVVTQ